MDSRARINLNNLKKGWERVFEKGRLIASVFNAGNDIDVSGKGKKIGIKLDLKVGERSRNE